MLPLRVEKWSISDVECWLKRSGFEQYVDLLCIKHKIDGKALLLLNEVDLRQPPLNIQVLGDVKRLSLLIGHLQQQNWGWLREVGCPHNCSKDRMLAFTNHQRRDSTDSASSSSLEESSVHSGRASKAYAVNLRPELLKLAVSCFYFMCVTWITSFTMVIVHDRVPDMKKYPPLPDLLLDNLPHIEWAFDMCEVCGTVLLTIWVFILFFHKYRFILLRRFFALSGTVYLLRCITMIITSLSVPGTHLKCVSGLSHGLWHKVEKAYHIWKGAGMSIQGVRSCGDYMFSGHTVALTMLNFFITEYAPKGFYFLHTFSWILNLFGVFFILAAHEHYSIDVFIAFYITSRLFLYYHTLANQQSLMQRDSKRVRVWFPLLTLFECNVEGLVPNEYEWPLSLRNIRHLRKKLKLL